MFCAYRDSNIDRRSIFARGGGPEQQARRYLGPLGRKMIEEMT